jgi:hypothetical protein
MLLGLLRTTCRLLYWFPSVGVLDRSWKQFSIRVTLSASHIGLLARRIELNTEPVESVRYVKSIQTLLLPAAPPMPGSSENQPQK